MASTQDHSAITIQEAQLSHVPSLSTMDIRAFHPANAYHRQVFPNTPSVLEWWSKIFTEEIKDPSAHVLIALDKNASDPANEVVGVINMRLMDPEVKSAGVWTMYEYVPDIDLAEFQPSIDVMTSWREKLFGESKQWHYLLEFVGVDHAYKGTGLGKRILERACEIADEKGYPVFVEGNQYALGFYQRCGFEEKGSSLMGSKEAYRQHVLIRPVGKK